MRCEWEWVGHKVVIKSTALRCMCQHGHVGSHCCHKWCDWYMKRNLFYSQLHKWASLHFPILLPEQYTERHHNHLYLIPPITSLNTCPLSFSRLILHLKPILFPGTLGAAPVSTHVFWRKLWKLVSTTQSTAVLLENRYENSRLSKLDDTCTLHWGILVTLFSEYGWTQQNKIKWNLKFIQIPWCRTAGPGAFAPIWRTLRQNLVVSCLSIR